MGTDTGGKQRDAAWWGWGDQIKYQKGGEKPQKIGGFGRKGQCIIDINEKLQTPTEKINALTEHTEILIDGQSLISIAKWEGRQGDT